MDAAISQLGLTFKSPGFDEASLAGEASIDSGEPRAKVIGQALICFSAAQLAGARFYLARVQTRRRWKPKKADLLGPMFDAFVRDLERVTSAIEQHIAAHEAALAIIRDYEYEVDKGAPGSGPAGSSPLASMLGLSSADLTRMWNEVRLGRTAAG